MVNVAFTGHRPKKLYGYNIYTKDYEALRDKCQEVFAYVEDKYGFIYKAYDGMAIGFDTIAFEELYFTRHNVRIIGCIPFAQQNYKWTKNDKLIYDKMKMSAYELVYVDTIDEYKVKGSIEGEYNVAKMTRRNEYMVDNSDVLICCWDKVKKGGTWHCIRYALQQDNIEEIININPNTLEIEILK